MAACLTQESFFVVFQEFDGIQFNCRVCPVGTQYTVFVKDKLFRFSLPCVIGKHRLSRMLS